MSQGPHTLHRTGTQLSLLLVPTVPHTGLGAGNGLRSTTSIYRDWGLSVSHILQVYSYISPGVGVSLWPETGRDSAELPKAQGGNWLMRAGCCHFWSGLLTVPM